MERGTNGGEKKSMMTDAVSLEVSIEAVKVVI